MTKFLGTTLAIAALAILGACSSGVDEVSPDAESTVEPDQTETYVEPATEEPGAMEDADKAADEMAPAEDKSADEMAPEAEGTMEEPSDEAPADSSADAPVEGEGGAAN